MTELEVSLCSPLKYSTYVHSTIPSIIVTMNKEEMTDSHRFQVIL